MEGEHLLLGLLHGEDTGALRLLDRLDMDCETIRKAAQANLTPEAAGSRRDSAQLSPNAKRIVQQARRETEATGDDYVGTSHLLLAMLRSGAATKNSHDRLFTAIAEIGLTYDTAVIALRDGASPEPEHPHLSSVTSAAVTAEPIRTPIVARPGFLRGRHLLSVNDLSDAEIQALFELTREIKAGKVYDAAHRKTAALLFEKPSLRTRTTFAVGMTRMGGAESVSEPRRGWNGNSRVGSRCRARFIALGRCHHRPNIR